MVAGRKLVRENNDVTAYFLTNKPAKFHPNPIFEMTGVFLKRVALTTRRRTTKMSIDMGQ